MIALQTLPAELHHLAVHLVEHATGRNERADPAPANAESLIRDFMVEMPVYRTYARGGEPANERDAAVIDGVRQELLKRGEHDPAMIELLSSVLLGPPQSDAGERFRCRFQQTTGPVMAK